MTRSLPYPPPWQDSVTLAAHISVSVSTLENWVAAGIIPPPRKRGGKLMWRWSEVDVRLAEGDNGALNVLLAQGLGGSTPAGADALTRARAGCEDFIAEPIRATLTFTVRNPGVAVTALSRVAMFEVTKYEPPLIFVTCRRTGETHKLLVGSDGAVARNGNRDDARRAAAIAHLALRAQTKAGEFADERAPHR